MPSRQAINVALSERKDIDYNGMGLWTRNKEFRREWNRVAAERRAGRLHSEPETAETGESERSQRALAERPPPMPSIQAINAGLGARKDIDYNAMSLWARQMEFRREWNRLAAERRRARVYYRYSKLECGQDEAQDDAAAVLRGSKG